MHSSEKGAHPIKARSKVKSGCGTCKTRKVKCDEGFPVCHRCASTGRTCDGYGVWGGGSAFANRQHPSRKDNSTGNRAIVIRPKHVSLVAADAAEKQAFDWFKCRTSVKMPGSFATGFWSTLALQASVSEPAVWHAVLALTTFHKQGRLHSDMTVSTKAPEKLERYVLQHLVQSIRDLQRHFSAKDRESLRVALISCIIYVSLDFLRGHFSTAQTHLRNGLSLLTDRMIKLEGCTQALDTRDASIDTWILEVVCRLYTQVALLKPTERQHCILFRNDILSQNSRSIFQSYKEAWEPLIQLMHEIFYLEQQSQAYKSKSPELALPSQLFQHQKRIRIKLEEWSAAFKASDSRLKPLGTMSEKGVYDVLYAYYRMAAIMNEVALFPHDESIFDLHTQSFYELVVLMSGVRHVSAELFRFAARVHESQNNLSRSMVDLGWIPPLYYAALKCRVHRIRLQAIRLLESSLHREGIWDAKILSIVLRKVMDVEERDTQQIVDSNDDFGLYTVPAHQDLAAVLPLGDRRLCDAEVAFDGEPTSKIMLLSRETRDGEPCMEQVAVYDMILQQWTDYGHGPLLKRESCEG